ncbi:cleavage induced hypothetical protein [Phytophthora infestans T30-4]|uniref:Uncharacterized protein n=2 Tax=Phytophthora infestans TaxID=4787 RepID=D0MVT0_PHYIT|nr:cleavage induced hypothetical protein [Phytophthora infestans T30-4]EEY63743.1 cleavage induced hypothetical protein [Phytophthora infestans T30-4]|eukprot:XP_002907179.1 cleavage induced hypothetical protein [Phytophthora infestans T30-4]
MVNSSQQVGNNAGTASSSTTNTSASMNTGTSVAHAIASLAHTENTIAQYNPLALQLQPPQDSTRHHINNATNNAAAVLTSVSRMPATAPKKRSTKSKCSPGLRSGKWTPEEEAFTNTIIHYFKRGLLDVEDGTSLRWYLAKRLNCEAMRVTKKLKGDSSIGKQIFRSVENTPVSRQAIRHAREEVSAMETRFLESLSGSGVGPGTQHIPSASLPSSLAVSVRGRKILPNMKNSDGQPLTLAPMPQPKSEDARLLMHFFCEAHDGSEEEPEDEKKVDKKAKSGSLSIDLSGKLGKKRPLSTVTNVDKTEETEDNKSPVKKVALSPPAKKQAVAVETVSPTAE